MENRRDELDRFKSEINLGEYACAVHGFVFDQRQSSRRSAVVRHSNGDKLVITRRPNRHFVYFNAKGDASDSGSILDFIQARRNVSLGKIRQELRAWSVVDANSSAISTPIVLEPSLHDASRVLRSWVKTAAVSAGNRYLLDARRIPSSTIVDPVFDGQIRTDARNNVLFAHRTLDGDLCGFEIKNSSFTGFSPGGNKSLFRSKSAADATTAILCETGIDLLSVAAIFGTQQKQFFSTAGQVSASQVTCVVQSLQAISNLKAVWLAFDNDAAGIKLAHQFKNELSKELPSVDVLLKLPEQDGFDWNDQLRQSSPPAAKPSP